MFSNAACSIMAKSLWFFCNEMECVLSSAIGLQTINAATKTSTSFCPQLERSTYIKLLAHIPPAHSERRWRIMQIKRETRTPLNKIQHQWEREREILGEWVRLLKQYNKKAPTSGANFLGLNIYKPIWRIDCCWARTGGVGMENF
jgi:hypothetical protein